MHTFLLKFIQYKTSLSTTSVAVLTQVVTVEELVTIVPKSDKFIFCEPPGVGQKVTLHQNFVVMNQRLVAVLQTTVRRLYGPNFHKVIAKKFQSTLKSVLGAYQIFWMLTEFSSNDFFAIASNKLRKASIFFISLNSCFLLSISDYCLLSEWIWKWIVICNVSENWRVHSCW